MQPPHTHLTENVIYGVYLADKSGDEQQHQDAVVVSTVTKEGLGHKGGEERNVSVGLTHLHLPQLHLDGLDTHTNGSTECETVQTLQKATYHFKTKKRFVSDLGVGLRLCKLNLEIEHLRRWLLLQFC